MGLRWERNSGALWAKCWAFGLIGVIGGGPTGLWVGRRVFGGRDGCAWCSLVSTGAGLWVAEAEPVGRLGVSGVLVGVRGRRGGGRGCLARGSRLGCASGCSGLS